MAEPFPGTIHFYICDNPDCPELGAAKPSEREWPHVTCGTCQQVCRYEART